MNHDRDDKELKVGDFVSIPCVIKETREHQKEGFNLAVETTEPFFPGDKPIELLVNSKQVVKI